MKVIVHQGVKHFRTKKGEPQDTALTQYIKKHSFFHDGLSVDQIKKQIKQKIRKTSHETNETKNRLQQLSLYLNNEKNKSIFEIYAIVLKNPKGVTYKDIDNKVKIGIVSVSHYCCRLKKMNFIELKSEKNQKVVYPKDANCERQQDDQEKNVKNKTAAPFHFNQLPMLDNIWINISSFESYKSNGITNQDIKQKLNKTSETKLIMKMVDQARDIFDFDKEMVSEGKVFQNRFKNVTKQIMDIQYESMEEENQTEQQLNPKIFTWLRNKFPQYSSQKFLFQLINNQFKGYLSAIGVKSARRTCTPIKLNRYIKILNSLHENWPQTHIELKNFIIDEEKQIQNGTMHKRSILGILNGLVEKEILKKIDHERQNDREMSENQYKMSDAANKIQTYYYPLWGPEGKQKDISQQSRNFESFLSKKNRSMHLASLGTQNKTGNKVSLNEYKNELRVRFLWATLQQLHLKILKKGFKKIFFTKRAKIVIKNYEPQTHIFSILEEENYRNVGKIRAENYQNFIAELDQLIENEGIKEDPIKADYKLVKMFRRNDKVKQNQLRVKFGNSWYQKLEPMIATELIESTENGIWKLKDNNRYFV